MEKISFSQKDRYDDLIQQIRLEYQKYEQLQQQIEREQNKIILNRLTHHQIAENVFQTNVKVFENVFEWYNLYQAEISYNVVQKLIKCENCKFYLIEIYIDNSLLDKIVDFKCFLNISVSSKCHTINKSIHLSNKCPIVEVLPVNESVEESTIFIYLFLPHINNTLIKVAEINIDYSYHFSKTKNKFSENPKFLKLARTYNKINVSNNFLEYEFRLNVKHTEFIKTFIKNCYHKLDIELFTELNNDSNSIFTINFYIGFNKNTIIYDRQTKIVKLKACVFDLVKLKRYFLTEFCTTSTTNANEIVKSIRVSEKDEFNVSFLAKMLCFRN